MEEWIPSVKKLGSNVQSRLSFAQSQFKSGDYDKAMAEVDVALQMDPGDPDALLLKAKILYDRGEFESSVAIARQAAAGMPDQAKPHLLIAAVRYEQNNTEAALAAADTAIATEPANAQAWLLRGNLLGALDRFAEAEPAFRRAIELFF